MLVDKIDFVEFDRQWRELFRDNPTHDLVVDGEVLEILGAGVPKRIQMGCSHYYVDESGLFLSAVHNHENKRTLEFRRKQEEIPSHWQRADSNGARIFRYVPVGASSTQRYVLNCERNHRDLYEIYITFYGHVLEFRVLHQETYTAEGAVEACEAVFMEMLHDLLCEMEQQ